MRRTPPALGIGLTCMVDQPAIWAAVCDHVDFVEITPDVLCRERIVGSSRSMQLVPGLLAAALEQVGERPMVVHGVELSIGSTTGWNASYVELLDRLWALRPFAWHSEHLGFLQAAGHEDGEVVYTGAPLPLPLTDEALELVAPRAAALCERYPTPFLLENGVHYFVDLPSERQRTPLGFLDEICARSGCDLLLDLFNLHCDARNQGFDARALLDRMDLEHVVEIHVAGGFTHEGYLLDAHNAAVPDEVWDLLDAVVPRAPRLGGIVFEVLPSQATALGAEAIIAQLERARRSWALRPTTTGALDGAA